MRRVVRLFVGFGLAILPASAQVLDGLATNYDGSVLYFSSSFGLRHQESVPHPKILKWSREDGFTIFAQLPNLGDLGEGVSNPYTLVDPHVTADGSIVSFLGTRICYQTGFRGICTVPNVPETTVIEGGRQAAVHARVVFSSNGRYMLERVAGGSPIWSDRETGERLALKLGGGVSTAHGITDDGRVLFAGSREVTLWSKSGQRAFPAEVELRDAGISANGRTIALAGWDLGERRHRAFVIDVESGQMTETLGTVARLSLSADGLYVVLLSQDPNAEKDVQWQAFLIRADGPAGIGAEWQITIAHEGIRDAVLTGDGHFVYAATNSNALLRYNVDTGATEEIAPHSPLVEGLNIVGVPGSLSRLVGSALSSESRTFASNLPRSFEGNVIELDGTPVPIRRVDPSVIEFQVPWSVTPGEKALRFPAPQSPFAEPEFRITIAPFHPTPAGFDPPWPYHQDGVTHITVANPALPGEVVYTDLSGLGELDGTLADGVAAPANPLLHSRRGVRLKIADRQGNSIDLGTQLATLAPGAFGTYRVAVRIPAAGLTPDAGSDQAYARLWIDPGGLFGPVFAGYVPVQLK